MIDALLQVVISGLTLGAMYAVGAVGLSITWGSLNVLNMAHGAMLTVGAYASFALADSLGLPIWIALLGAILLGGALGALVYYAVLRRMMERPGFEVNVIIATVGLAFVFENTVLQTFGGYPLRQPANIEGGFNIGAVYVPFRSLAIMSIGIAVMMVVSAFLERTRTGRAIRAVSQNRDAARLMGIGVDGIFSLVLVMGGALSAASGIMLSTVTTLSPGMGYDPMLKAFIVCVLGGLGNTRGALAVAFGLGLAEAAIQYSLGVRFALPLLLLAVIGSLIWRPAGLFGRQEVVRL